MQTENIALALCPIKVHKVNPELTGGYNIKLIQ